MKSFDRELSFEPRDAKHFRARDRPARPDADWLEELVAPHALRGRGHDAQWYPKLPASANAWHDRMMSKGKKPPERSKIERAKPLAYQRRASENARVGTEDNSKPIEVEAKAPGAEPEVTSEERETGEMTAVANPSEADAPKVPVAAAAPAAPAPATSAVAPAAAPAPAPPTSAAAPVEAPMAEPPKADPVRTSRETGMMTAATTVGVPPEVPGDVEDPTQMPGPNDVPTGSPMDAAKAPGHVPAGDSRSLRRDSEFALIYRQGSAVITRFGTVGQRGQWRVVEYPTPSSASNAYAKECSRFVGEGFSDYRD